ncbi:MAG: hypothetical protein LKH33_08390 [Acetobacter sp.]|jgi:hypothetical protein|nr:hypothetical protein [Acetobacter sp.]MCI1485812.1 hypothetical protein [Acetobacter sp.]MCI1529806.1 hypothetical protein [Acetobacter sp.]MCI1587525.1 hypothetical protein [Acetobacter sp.]MCI1601742.1 hypothetical protein [Acetobacter sp.]
MSDAVTTMNQNASQGNYSPAAIRRFSEAKHRTTAVTSPDLADILRLVPSEDQMTKIVLAFGVEAGDVDELTGAGSNMVREQYDLMFPILVTLIRGEQNFNGLRMHLDRVVDGLIRSAYGAANFYENRRAIAKDAADSYANDHRDEDRMGVDGGENRVDGLRRIAAENGAKAFALSCLASGACAAYEELMGQAWKPYSRDNGRSLSRDVAAFQADAMGF